MPERKGIVQIVDAGGRAAVLAQAYANSPDVERILVAPGNDLIKFNCAKPVETFPNLKTTDVEGQLKLATERGVTLVDVAQDNAIERGLADRLQLLEIPVLGPTRRAGRIEWDKIFARMLMQLYKMPIPRFTIYGDEEPDYQRATDHMLTRVITEPVFLKACGLAAGKGAFPIRSQRDVQSSLGKLKELKTEGGKGFLVEEWVEGEEFSGYFLGYGGAFKELGYAQDHKRINNNDEGSNTGGMGAIAPVGLVDSHLASRVRKEVINPLAQALAASRTFYNGVLYLGGMYNAGTDQLWVVEFNSRWGDPEAQVIVPGINTDFYHLGKAAAEGSRTNIHSFDNILTEYDGKARVNVVASSLGYPDDYSKVEGRKIEGLDGVIKRGDITVYGAGVKVDGDNFYANGGRLFHLMAEGETVEDARAKAAAEMSRVHIKGDKPGEDLLHYRTDIGLKEVQRLKD